MFKRASIALPAALVVALSGCEAGTSGGGGALDTDAQKASYAVGLNMGGQLSDAEGILDLDALSRGIGDAMAGNDPAITQEEIQSSIQWLQGEVTAAAQARAEENRTEGEAYLAQNAENEGVMVTESGLQYEVLREGEGDSPTASDQVRLHYRGTLIDGTEFDSSYDGEPVVFGAGGLIPGFTEALLMMSPGSHYRIAIPSDLAYGPQGSQGGIGPNETLIFEIELLEVLEADSAAGGGQD